MAVAIVGGLLVVGTYLRGGESGSRVVVENKTGKAVTVYVTFGSDSVVHGWPFCPASGGGCKFSLGDQPRELPTQGKYLNATLSFGGPVDCGKTKVEVNVNNPTWFDVLDVSLVDGFDQAVAVSVTDSSGSHTLGPVRSATGNEKAFGVYPLGCDICVDRQAPPCGTTPGSAGCKSGSQYNPDVPCQYQSTARGGGSESTITLL